MSHSKNRDTFSPELAPTWRIRWFYARFHLVKLLLVQLDPKWWRDGDTLRSVGLSTTVCVFVHPSKSCWAEMCLSSISLGKCRTTLFSYIPAFLHCYFRCCAVSIHSVDVCWEMPFWLSHFPPPRASSQRCWEVPPALHSLVTAHSQRSQAQDSGTAPRSGLGVRGVSLETQHKYQDPNNLITSGDIRSRILGAHPLPFVFGEVQGTAAGDGMVLQGVSAILLICSRPCKDVCCFGLRAKQCFSVFTSNDLQWVESCLESGHKLLLT